MADRVKVHRPIIYGSHSRLLTEAERASAPDLHTHKWTVFVTSAASPPPKEGEADNIDYLPGGADDLGYLIKRITFKLHDTYTPPSRIIDRAPFKVTETGWGEFIVNIRIQFIPEANEKPINLSHMIRLHHFGPRIEGLTTTVDSPALSAPVETSAAPTPAPEPIEEKTAEASAEPTPATIETKDEEKMDESSEGVKLETLESIPAQSPSIVAVQPGQPETSVQLQPVSIAAKLPVHSWQYDELVFSDPPAAFLEILNEHPPTPLPAKFRRPKDQREKVEGPKKKKGRPSTIRDESRAQTQEPGAGTPVPAAPGVGIPGESGSADVPLEFAKEMETGEFNFLTDARLTIIDQMDKWRTRLIAQEKELAKLKDEMKLS